MTIRSYCIYGGSRLIIAAVFSLAASFAAWAAPADDYTPEDAYPPAEKLVESPGGAAYYVDPVRGDDANAGTDPAKPWRSLKRVNRLRLAAGDCVHILPGKFTETLKPSGVGTAERPIEIRFAPGEFDFWPENALKLKLHISNANDDPYTPKAIALAFAGVKHLRVEGGTAGGGKSDVFVHGRMIEVFFDHVEDVRLEGMAFDYRRPTMSECTVTALADDHADIAVHPDSTYEVKDGKLTWIGEGWQLKAAEAQTQDTIPEEARTWRSGNPFQGVSRMEELSPFKIRAFFKKNPGFTPGHVYEHRNPFRDCAGAFARDSKDIVLKDCAFYYMHGLGFVAQFCENLIFDGCWLAPRPESGRTNAGWADGLHLSGVKGKVVVSGCYFSGYQDDPINIHGTYLRVVEKLPGSRVRVRFMHPQSYGFAAFYPGDEVALVRGESLKELSRNRVVVAEMSGDKEMLLTLEKQFEESLGANDVLENITWNPEVVIRDCHCEGSPTHGFVLTSRGPTLVEGCTFRGIEMSPIALAEYVDAYWYESGPVHNVVIRGNRFLSCGGAPVLVNPGNRADEGPVCGNVRIEGNFFGTNHDPAIRAKSVRGLTVIHNRFAASKMPAIAASQSLEIKIESNQVGAKE